MQNTQNLNVKIIMHKMRMTETYAQAIHELAEENDIQLSQQAKLFIYGVKPAYLESHRLPEIQFLMRFYPSLPISHRASILLFQSAQQMLEYISDGGVRIIRVRPDSETTIFDYDHEKLGIALGFPPFVCKWFVEKQQIKTPEQIRNDPAYGFDYHGLYFACPPELVEYTIDYLKTHRPVPAHIQRKARYEKRVDGKKIEVEF